MGVTRPPATEENLPHVRLVVAIGILEEQHVRGLRHDEPPTRKHDAGRDTEFVGKDGHLVTTPVPIGVLQDLDGVLSLSLRRFEIVGIVPGFRHETAPALVPGQGAHIGNLWLGGKKLQVKTSRDLDRLHRLLCRDRVLEPGRRIAPLVVGNILLGELELRNVQALPVGGGLLAHRPEHPAADEFVESGIGPGALVMSPGGVEHAPLAMSTHPGPRLLVTIGENRAILLVVLVVHIGLIPALKTFESLHHRMTRLRNAGPEHPGSVALELPPQQFDHARIYAEARRGTVDRNIAAPGCHVIEDSLLL